MSIDDLILDRVRRKMLFPLVPKAPGVVVGRTMLLGERLNKIITAPPSGDADWEMRLGTLQADLEQFADRDHIIGPKYLYRLAPARDRIWEIRSVADDPSIRVLGAFIKTDVFVATHYALRSDLGGWETAAWKAAKRQVLADWRVLFATYKPRPERDVHKLVTGALKGEYFRD